MNRFELLDFIIDTLDSQLPVTLHPDKVDLPPDERTAYRAIIANIGAENFTQLETFVRTMLWGNNLAFVLQTLS